jgi:hypothetical protein
MRFGCTTVITLAAGGTITTEGILVDVTGATSVAAVTGGTGAYRGTAGEASLTLGAPGGPHAARRVLIR